MTTEEAALVSSLNGTKLPLDALETQNTELEEDLQSLSDICVHIRLTEQSAQAAVLVDSIQRHVVSPIRRHLQTAVEAISSTSFCSSSSWYCSSTLYDDRYVTRLVTTLIHRCCTHRFYVRDDLPNEDNIDNNDETIAPLCDVLDILLDYMRKETPSSPAYLTLKTIWGDILSIIGDHLYRWLQHGVIQDQAGQFFIAVEETPTGTNVQVQPARLPSFVSRHMAKSLIFTGTAAKCASLLTSSTVSPRTAAKATSALDLDKELTVTLEKMRQNPLSSSLVFEAASATWRGLAAQHLSRILPFDAIRERIRHLRDFLLQGNSTFWRCVFDDMRTNPHLALRGAALTEEQRIIAERVLNHILASTAVELDNESSSSSSSSTTTTSEIVVENERRKSSSSPTNQKALNRSSTNTTAPFVLHVADDCSVTPRFTLTLAETHVLASRASVYCDAFAVTFGLRRTACELRAAFQPLLSLERAIRRGHEQNNMNFLHGNDGNEGQFHVRRRVKTACLARMMELWRRMMNFIGCVEWYIQATVIQPKFDRLLSLLDDHNNNKNENSRFRDENDINFAGQKSPPFFDRVTETHNKVMDELLKECFVADDAINVRLINICDVCVNMANSIREATPQTVKRIEFAQAVANMHREFKLNVDLFKQMLMVYKTNIDSQVARLLLQLDYHPVVEWT